jgi:hypothetical protein
MPVLHYAEVSLGTRTGFFQAVNGVRSRAAGRTYMMMEF